MVFFNVLKNVCAFFGTLLQTSKNLTKTLAASKAPAKGIHASLNLLFTFLIPTDIFNNKYGY